MAIRGDWTRSMFRCFCSWVDRWTSTTRHQQVDSSRRFHSQFHRWAGLWCCGRQLEFEPAEQRWQDNLLFGHGKPLTFRITNRLNWDGRCTFLTKFTDAVPWSCTERNVGVRMTSFALFLREAIRIVRVRIRIKSWIVMQSVDRNDKFAVFR